MRSGTVSRPLAPPPRWTRAFLREAQAQLQAARPNEQATSMLLVALARLGMQPSTRWAASAAVHVSATLPRPSAQALATSMWALATMGFSMNAEGLQAFETRLLASLGAHGAVPVSSSTTTNSEHAGLEQATEPWRVAVAAGGVPGGWSGQELSNVLWALARWRHRPSDAVLELLLGRVRALCLRAPSSSSTDTEALVKPQELANVLWALSALRVQPSRGWLDDVWGACAARIGAFNAKDLSQLVYALAKLNRQPTAAAGANRQPTADGGLVVGWVPGNLQRPGEEEGEEAQAAAEEEEHGLQWDAALPASAPAAQQGTAPRQQQQQRSEAAAAAPAGTAVQLPPRPGSPPTAGPAAAAPVGPALLSALPSRSLAVEDISLLARPPARPRLAPSPQPHHHSDAAPAAAPAAVAPRQPPPRKPAPAADPKLPLQDRAAVAAAGGAAAAAAAAVPAWARALLPEAVATFGKFGSQDLANLGWGLARLGVRPGQAWCERLATELRQRGGGFSGAHLATCVWALGSLGFRPEPASLLPLEGALYKCVALLCLVGGATKSCVGLSRCARWGWIDMGGVARVPLACRRLASLAPRELAACCWGFAAMKYVPDRDWLEAFAAQCRKVAQDFTQQVRSPSLPSLPRALERSTEPCVCARIR